jgi:DNA-binding transcriptional MocR family regulator
VKITVSGRAGVDVIPLDGPGPLHERLRSTLRGAICSGRLTRGSALPPSRKLAAELGCSRWVVTEAYAQLVAEGYLEARTGSPDARSLGRRRAGRAGLPSGVVGARATVRPIAGRPRSPGVPPAPLGSHRPYCARLAAEPGGAGEPPLLEQLAFAKFLESGAYDRHLRASRQRYRVRHDAFVRALERHLPGCQVSGAAAGLRLLLTLNEGCPAATVVVEAARRGVRVLDLDDCRAAPDPGSAALVLGYCNLADDAVEEAVRRLAAAVRAAARHPPG